MSYSADEVMLSGDIGSKFFDDFPIFICGGLCSGFLVYLVEGVALEIVLHNFVQFTHYDKIMISCDNRDRLDINPNGRREVQITEQPWEMIFCCFLQFYSQMLKNQRSMSQTLHKLHVNDFDISHNVPNSTELRFRKVSAQFTHTQNTHNQFGQAKSFGRDSRQTIVRNKSLSSTKLKIFEKAHYVNKNESFQKQIIHPPSKNICLSASNSQFSQYKVHKKQALMSEIVEKKLIISKVLQSLEDQNKPRLTIRGQLTHTKEKQDKKVASAIDHVGQSKWKSDLTLSKDLQLESKITFCNRCSEDPIRVDNQFHISRDEETLKNYSKQLTQSIHQSIKKEMEEHYLTKERELEQRYHQKQLQYLEKFKSLESAMQTKLEKERNLLLANINIELQKQFAKVKQITAQIKKEEIAIEQKSQRKQSVTFKDKVEQKIEQYQAISEIPAKINRQRKPSRNIQQDSIIIPQAKTIQKPTISPPIFKSQSNKGKQTEPAPLTQKQAKSSKQKDQKPKTIFNEVDSILDDIQQVKLDSRGKVNNKNLVKPTEESQNDRMNKSFNVDKKLNDSFSSQRPKVNKNDQQKKAQQQQPMIPSKIARQPSQEQKRKAQVQQRKTIVRAKLKEHYQNDTILVAIGQVAGYCSRCCKKSKVDWKIPSLLLYRFSLDHFRSYKSYYEEGEKLKLVKKEDLDNYINYNKVMEDSLLKMYKSIEKKVVIDQLYRQIVESNAIEVERLRPYVIKQARKYVQELRKSSQSSKDKGDSGVVQCGLRIINSLFIIKKLNGQQVELITDNIDELSKEETFGLFDEWFTKMNQSS